MQLMQHMPVDIDQIAAVNALRDTMKLPDLFEQSSLHERSVYESSVYDCLGQIGLHILVGSVLLSKRPNRRKDNSCRASSVSIIWFSASVISRALRLSTKNCSHFSSLNVKTNMMTRPGGGMCI